MERLVFLCLGFAIGYYFDYILDVDWISYYFFGLIFSYFVCLITVVAHSLSYVKKWEIKFSWTKRDFKLIFNSLNKIKILILFLSSWASIALVLTAILAKFLDEKKQMEFKDYDE